MRALKVVAHTPAGLARKDPWSPALEAILAYWVLRDQLDEETFALGATGHAPIVEADIPLGREQHDGQWWWQCSSPIVDVACRHQRAFHRRLDIGPGTRFTAARRIEVKAGPYKQSRLHDQIDLTPTVTWHAIGDEAQVRALLRRCVSIGAGTARGLGRVARWEVTADGDPDLARFHRPLPEDFALARGRDGMRLLWGIRPPGRLPDHQLLCVMP